MAHKIAAMTFASISDALVSKVERKGGVGLDVFKLMSWLTGYSSSDLEHIYHSTLTYGDFFAKAPHLNPNRIHITGTICGCRIESLDDSFMQDVRRLDKLVDRLARGKTVEQILEMYDKKSDA